VRCGEDITSFPRGIYWFSRIQKGFFADDEFFEAVKNAVDAGETQVNACFAW
jgi:hypothetical protein